jgi:hypothetical protein
VRLSRRTRRCSRRRGHDGFPRVIALAAPAAAELGLSAANFPPGPSVVIRFPDGSHVQFRHAFAVPDEAGREVAVFTEHCGYHVFPVGEAEVEVVQSVGSSMS